MASELIINVTEQETRVALLEHGALVEFHVEMAHQGQVVGNIYKGRIHRVLPGMQAAFVDIGLERAAFLYVSDVVGHYEESANTDPPETLDYDEGANGGEDNAVLNHEVFPRETVPIEQLLREGQDILVQVVKEPLGTKGARVSNHVSLPGRYLVLMPTMNHVGVSRRIEDADERTRLKEMVESIRPSDDVGFIVRTVAEGVDEATLRADVEMLVGLWEQVRDRDKVGHAPTLIHSDLSIALRAVRDLLTADVERVLIDDREEYDKILELYGERLPGLNTKIELYKDDEPVFDRFNLEIEVSRAIQRKVWLKSGGYIIIEHTEALTSIDVNTGRYVGKHNFDETILKTNLEALKEICYQLRLRNIGGIIVVDFIDMSNPAHREKVQDALLELLKKDKARTNVLSFSDLGLVEMTRKRTRENIVRLLSETCPYCDGRGYVKSRRSICAEIYRAALKQAKHMTSDTIVFQVNPEIADLLLEEEQRAMEDLERRFSKHVVVRERPNYHIEQYEILDG
ncbi:MAG: Rne/Rng family ribonuclease [Deltaproteobacteria bacterium]|nr:Rne/Rng family ribonuclease [Deltaproteobacteria bacterium]